ncbi:DUF3265 domain-containing protein [Vibrio vulnificus]|uniref:hypothetical protein n=1 Tax=Vibrio vulnificus TaxID=672 RepID=UPI001E3BA850|nr:DUF3265 domain-containing protein [Vibrio vulnificus]MCD1422727.1 DUF3265 domain-containing protein [Vibrio vulnificus]
MFSHVKSVGCIFSLLSQLSNFGLVGRRLSGIHAAWHFWYAVSFGGESGLREVGLGGIHPLTQRYVLGAL